MAINNAVNNAPNANLAQHSVPVVGAAGLLSSIGPLTNGQLCIGSTSNAPVAGNLTSTGGSIAITNGAGTINLETTAPVVFYSLSPYIVGLDAASQYSTIQAGINAATAAGGGNVYIKPGTYTENPTLAAGVNLIGFGFAAVINGKCSFSGGGEVNIQGITLQTNGDYALEITGSSAATVNLDTCYLNLTNHTGINYTNSSSSSTVIVFDTDGDLGTTGITYVTKSAVGYLGMFECSLFNSAGSSTPISVSAGDFYFQESSSFVSIDISSTARIYAIGSSFLSGSYNIYNLHISGSSNNFVNCSYLYAGSATAVIVDGILFMTNCPINSTATNVISGSGTLNTAGNACYHSSGVSVSTVNHLTVI